MRKSLFCCILIMVLAAVLVASLASCKGWFEPKPDRELFGNYEPLEWKDSYIFAATNYYPPQVQVWDTADGEVKFVRAYNLWVDKRDLTIWDLAVLDKILWITAHGMQFNLIRVDLETGKTRFLDLDMNPHFVQAIPEGNDGRGCIVSTSYCHGPVGVDIRMLDNNGNILRTLHLGGNNELDVGSPDQISYQHGHYFVTGNSPSDFEPNEVPSGYRVLDYNATSGKYTTEVSEIELISENAQILETLTGLPFSYSTNFINHPPAYTGDPNFVELGFFTGSGGRRFLMKCSSFIPAKFEYTNICQTVDRSIHSATQDGEKIFLTGRTLDINYSDLNGLETGVYPASGGSQLKRIEMPDGNQLHCTELPECTWFSCNVWGTDKYGDFVHKGTIPRIYRLDYATESVTCYWADGRVEKMRELPD